MTALHTFVTETEPARTRLRAALEQRFGIDARALAIFRIALGLILLFDTVHRSQDLVAFYTDAGVLPRQLHLEQSDRLVRYSLHMLSGEPWFQFVLFALTAALAVLLIVGYRTRLVTLLSAILLISLHVRNPLVLNAGDRLFREVLVLAVFLPLGSRWAIDSRSDERLQVTSPATVATLVYVVTLFFNNAVHKTDGDTWLTGEALRYALRQDHMTILLGNSVVNYQPALEMGTYVWFGLLACSPLLLVFGGRLRIAYVAVFLSAACGMAVSMAVGLFPALLATLLLLFLPARVWDALEAAGVVLLEREGSLARIQTAGRRLRTRIGRPRGLRSVLSDPARRRHRQVWTVVLWCMGVLVVLWCVGLFGFTAPFEPVESVDPEEHQWRMYAPDPSANYGWYVVGASLETGEEVDVLRDTELDDHRTVPPPDASVTLPNFRWRKYMNSLSDSEDRTDRFAAYMCDHANEQFEPTVESVTVTYTNHPIDLENETDPTVYDRGEATCSESPRSER